MRSFIYTAIVVFLMGMIVGCEDELIASANDRTKEMIEVNAEPENVSVSDTIGITDTTNDEEIKYPIGFGVTVDSYNEYGEVGF